MKGNLSALLKAVKGMQSMADQLIAEGHGEDPAAGEGMVEDMGEMGEAQESLKDKVAEAEAEMGGGEHCESSEDLDENYKKDFMKRSNKSSPMKDRKEMLIMGLRTAPKVKGK